MLEVPSGVWADRFSRRRLLTLSPALSGAGFALWTFLPSYGAFAAGFVLWGAGSSLRSGTLEALVYEELKRAGAAGAYGRLLGRSRALSTLAETAATAVAAPVLAAGGYRAVGIASVLVCVAGVAVARTFPEHRDRSGGSGRSGGVAPDGGPARDGDPAHAGEPAHDGDPAGDGDPAREGGFGGTLRAGLTEIRTSRPARRAVLLVSLLTGCLAYDEYLPLLAAATGADTVHVPLLVVLVSAGAAAGNWYADRGHARAGPLLTLAAVCLAAGALSGHPAGMALVAAGYGLCTWAATAAAARLQDRIADRTRATVGSLAGLGSEVVSVLFFAAYALGSTRYGPGPLIAVAALPYAVTALALRGRRT